MSVERSPAISGDFFSGNSTSKMRRCLAFGVVVDFVLFTLKLKDGMIKIKKINLNEEVELKLY